MPPTRALLPPHHASPVLHPPTNAPPSPPPPPPEFDLPAIQAFFNTAIDFVALSAYIPQASPRFQVGGRVRCAVAVGRGLALVANRAWSAARLLSPSLTTRPPAHAHPPARGTAPARCRSPASWRGSCPAWTRSLCGTA